MKPVDFLKELVYPLTEIAVLLAIAGFALLTALVLAAGSVIPGAGWLLGLALLVIYVLPAFFRYLLQLLDARARGLPAPVVALELFDIADNFWSLTPLVLYAAAIWGGVLLKHSGSVAAAQAFVAVLAVAFPASVAVLAITRSPLTSLSPVAWWRVMKACGPAYAGIVGVSLVSFLGSGLAVSSGLPSVVAFALAFYPLFLSFSFTGAVLNAKSVLFLADFAELLDDPDPDGVEAARNWNLTHAYGFISRGNRAGGLAHLQSAIDNEANRGDAFRWYFERMQSWENGDAVLFLAQNYLSWLLEEERETEALKLLTACLHREPTFRPLPTDRPLALALARRRRREDLIERLA